MAQLAYATNHQAQASSEPRPTLGYTMQDTLNEVLGRANIATVLAQLHHLPERCGKLEQDVVNFREEIALFKGNMLAIARESYDQAVLAASMEATCDGKNAEQRKMQLDVHLAKDESVAKAGAALRARENELSSKESELSLAEGDLRKAQMAFKAALAECALIEALVRSYSTAA